MYYKVNLIEKGVYIWFEKLKKKNMLVWWIFFFVLMLWVRMILLYVNEL